METTVTEGHKAPPRVQVGYLIKLLKPGSRLRYIHPNFHRMNEEPESIWLGWLTLPEAQNALVHEKHWVDEQGWVPLIVKVTVTEEDV